MLCIVYIQFIYSLYIYIYIIKHQYKNKNKKFCVITAKQVIKKQYLNYFGLDFITYI